MAWQRGQDHDGLLDGFSCKTQQPRALTRSRLRIEPADRGMATDHNSTADARRTQSSSPASAGDDSDRWPLAD